MLRAKEEVVGKAHELAESARALQRKAERVLNRLTVLFFIFLLFGILNLLARKNIDDDSALKTVVIAIGYISSGIFVATLAAMLIFHFYFKTRWLLKARKRQEIGMCLAEVAGMMDKEDGESLIIAELDKMIVERGKTKASKFKVPSFTRIDCERKTLESARIEAFTWVASPGGMME